MMMRPAATDVIVVGGGPIGLAIAWRLLHAGRTVTVVEADEPEAAWRVSAGMLSPPIEADYGQAELSLLSVAALADYPAFLAELEAESGVATHYARVGSLAVALDRDQLEALRRRFELLRDERRLAVAWLPGAECRELEPLLSPRVTAGIHAADDAQVDPRRLVGALRVAIARRGGILHDARVDGLELAGGRVVGVRVGDEGLSAGTVVLAAGAWMGSLGAQAAALRIRPVKGQILRLQTSAWPSMLVETEHIYAFRRPSGEVVLGATVEEQGFRPGVTAGGMFELLDEGLRTVPGMREWTLEEPGVGFRPAAPDNAPVIGELGPGLVAAGGHYRSGILLTWSTAEAICQLVEHGALPELVAPFAPDRLGLS